MSDRPLSDTSFAWVPALRWMRAYTAQNVRVDLIAGLVQRETEHIEPTGDVRHGRRRKRSDRHHER